MIEKESIGEWFKGLQADICRTLENTDGQGVFVSDEWERPGGGGGVSRVLTNGRLIEKGGVNFSAVWGKAPAPVLKSLHLDPNSDLSFYATGVSIVIHPNNPFVPIIHMNVRYFEMTDGTWWFGGGIDLTPHYVVEEDARFFHQQLKDACDKHDASFYPAFKKWADEYFYIRHRKETRGIGGIFFDYLKGTDGFTKESRFAFVKDVGLAFAPTYVSLMKKNADVPFNDQNKSWQSIRRGRYVEFNLVWDRGTKFGLDTDGRTESILMSLPPIASWLYMHQPEPGSEEEKTLSYLKQDINWI
ncbi:MAG: oxygen-dependent coproporphyrinogen oxidase [Chryseolinea sp.]